MNLVLSELHFAQQKNFQLKILSAKLKTVYIFLDLDQRSPFFDGKLSGRVVEITFHVSTAIFVEWKEWKSEL